MMKRTITNALLLVSTFFVMGTADAAPKRVFKPQPVKHSRVDVMTFDSPSIIMRTRTGARDHAVFSADPQSIEDGAVLVFEVMSDSKTGSVRRWRCVAVEDVAECLGEKVRLRYLPNDEAIRMTITAKSARTPEAIAHIRSQGQFEVTAN